MTKVRQIANTQDTITVETEYGQTLVLTIVAENAGVYAVNYEDGDARKAGQFVDGEGSQELYEASEDDCFEGYDHEFQCQKTDNAGSLCWVNVTEDAE